MKPTLFLWLQMYNFFQKFFGNEKLIIFVALLK